MTSEEYREWLGLPATKQALKALKALHGRRKDKLLEDVYYRPEPADPERREKRVRQLYETRAMEEFILDIESGPEWMEEVNE